MLLLFGTLTNKTAFQFAAPLLGIGVFVYSPLLAVMVAEAAGPALAGSATGEAVVPALGIEAQQVIAAHQDVSHGRTTEKINQRGLVSAQAGSWSSKRQSPGQSRERCFWRSATAEGGASSSA
jgi:hypothetical protein